MKNNEKYDDPRIESPASLRPMTSSSPGTALGVFEGVGVGGLFAIGDTYGTPSSPSFFFTTTMNRVRVRVRLWRTSLPPENQGDVQPHGDSEEETSEDQ